ncbi:phytanoyl-CoA dioxygenase family protein [Micromonospora sp. NBC_01813]|uniref:phytanoyl-CoA dioxygenase family protein n=1 Tax=Micromonospora sp. NBC_01813 TaxID=2975988 RepID=UPI002DD9A39B|nr:phytanoyl-CoA dioxygenase family protein [Micromonospora sp. NBC_01813]WSA07955.1 phytanoyl-CoA dioxygenase family protein [Micromonospora sp. NBC_01813]
MLSHESVDLYREDGFLFADPLTEKETDILREQADREFLRDSPGRMLEKDGFTVRGVHGSHVVNSTFARLVRHPKIVTPAMRLLGGPVYVHQFKINAKKALAGDVWPWHQDYIFWNRGDGMRRPDVVNVAVLLDEATDLNGPLLFLPGSHKCGSLEAARRPTTEGGDEAWRSDISADLAYAIDAPLLAKLTEHTEVTAVKGPPGSMIFFDPLLVHASGANMAPYDRRMILVTYNRVDNRLGEVPSPRPDFLAARDNTPVRPLDPGADLFAGSSA